MFGQEVVFVNSIPLTLSGGQIQLAIIYFERTIKIANFFTFFDVFVVFLKKKASFLNLRGLVLTKRVLERFPELFLEAVLHERFLL